MTADELRDFLTQHQIKFKGSQVQHGIKFVCPGGEIFIVYDTGRVKIQGKRSALSDSVKEWYDGGKAPVAMPAKEPPAAVPAAGPNRRVFIVYGHDVPCRESLELLLHKMGMEPIVFGDLPATGRYDDREVGVVFG